MEPGFIDRESKSHDVLKIFPQFSKTFSLVHFAIFRNFSSYTILCKEKTLIVEAGSKSFNEQTQVTSVSVS